MKLLMAGQENVFLQGHDYIAGWDTREDLQYVSKFFGNPLTEINKSIDILSKITLPIEIKLRDSTAERLLVTTREMRMWQMLRIKLHKLKEDKQRYLRKYENLLRRVIEDQTAYDEDAERHFDPWHVIDKANRVVRSGLDRCADLITAETILSFSHLAVGESEIDVKTSDEQLGLEITRVKIKNVGTITSLGDAIRIFGIIPTNTTSAELKEVGAFDTPVINTGTMWFRSVYTGGKVLKHEKDKTFPTVYHIIYLTSK